MKQKIKVLSLFFLSVLFTITNHSFFTLPSHAEDLASYADFALDNNQKVYSNATMQYDFAADRILVVLNHEKSLKFNTYSTQDFGEIKCKSVKNLTASTKELVTEKLKIQECIMRYGILANTERLDSLDKINPITYKQILCIELEQPGKDKVLEAISLIENREDILYAGPDFITSLCSVEPNDQLYSHQWAPETINLPAAWNLSTGSSTIKVGVIDSGIDGTHPDLVNQINANLCRDFSTGGEIVTTVPNDPHGHGTRVAGIIGAEGNNGNGISGVCWDVELISLRVTTAEGYAYSSDVARAIDYATQQNIPILNLSLGWSSDIGNLSDYDCVLNTCIANYPGLLVCSAGNNNKNTDTNSHYPSVYRLANLISVGASSIYDQLYTVDTDAGSNFGHSTVDIFAPGESIASTVPDSGYAYSYGTSFAVPHVTGVAALLLSVHPELTASEVKQIIMGTVDIVYDSNGNDVFGDLCVSGGRLNAYKALTSALLHSLQYTNLGISAGHTATCTECGCSYTEAHDWVIYPTHAICNTCGVVSENVTRPQIAPLPEIKEEIE